MKGEIQVYKYLIIYYDGTYKEVIANSLNEASCQDGNIKMIIDLSR